MNEPLVLIVEHDRGVQRVVQAVLERRLGCRTVLAATLTAAVELIRREPPDLVILSLDLPGVDPFALVRHLMSDLATWTIPVIALSAMAGRRQESLAAGCADYVEKPFGVSDFVERAREQLATRRSARTADRTSRETVLAILKLAHDDLAFRRRFEQDPDAVLAEYPDLGESARGFLRAYPSQWLTEHSIEPCPRCGGDAVVSTTGDVVFCSTCPDGERCGR